MDKAYGITQYFHIDTVFGRIPKHETLDSINAACSQSLWTAGCAVAFVLTFVIAVLIVYIIIHHRNHP